MFAIFESILPIFLLIIAGNVLRRTPLISDETWPGLEQLCYWFLYPSLLFITIANADFSELRLDAMLGALIVSVLSFIALVLALWPALRATGLVRHAQYSSVFQTAVRWNGFMALAVAQKLFPPEGAAVVALVMATIIIPINIASVFVVTRFADSTASLSKVMLDVARNPMILAAATAVLLRFMPFDLYPPLNQTLDLVGRAALGMGLLTIGASLQTDDFRAAGASLWISSFLKLLFFPVLMIAVALGFGVSGPALSYLALCAAVPTAMNGFLLARQLGGDAPLYASITTVQTALAFFTIPLVLTLVSQFVSG
ncbi:AEC family transporter [Nitratireductor sp. GZWM139]|uniref:AEC family transporter n=1 Tax=Nitratireductor sp. GZWM139 TaxID=2950541 RepID=UPI0024BE802C|nr:AEC family transporter [Nitratireductor sp. GZWM139]MDJ1464060.1 AEC family transporter [Nitratireductor sp. GZWM139]